MTTKHSLATEVIDFQRGGFIDAFIALIGAERAIYRKTNGSPARAHTLGQSLCQALTDRFHIKLVPVMLEGTFNFGIMPPIMDKNHVFYSKNYMRESFHDWDPPMFRKNLDKILSYKENSLSLAKAEVYGGFTQISCEMYMSSDELWETVITDEEIAAILLHEVGHAFTFFEFMGKVTAINQILGIVYDEQFDLVPTKTKEYFIEQIKGRKDDELLKGLEAKNGPERVTVLIRTCVAQSSSVSLGSHYDQTNCEALADNFAARFGLGRALVTGLDKLSVKDPDYRRNRSSTIMTAMAGTAYMILVTVGVALFSPALSALYGAVILAALFLSSGESARDYTYDRLRVRYLRIREQMVHSLKDRKVPNLDKILADIKVVDDILAGMREYNGFIDAVFNVIFTKDKEAVKTAAIQRQLEEIANNDLFIKAAQLKAA